MAADSSVAVNGGGGVRAAEMGLRGTKRGASDSNLSDFERFEKRLRLLSLRNSGKNNNGKSNLYTPISHSPTTTTPNGASSNANHVSQSPENDTMQVDDTRDRVYIHDLDAELADIESDEEKLIYLPDIEKKLSKLPRQVLGGREDDYEGQELVLYSVPKSLTVDEGHDSVRKAIIESRQRAREKAAEEARYADMERKYDWSGQDGGAETAHGYGAGYVPNQELEDDPDAMDIG
ncbi:uncharacterized protein LTR77_003907 [Saxophila tyrrhenica]|uniref:Uncharacterized protein n=1 Tax=Saxophila tyrrhenica TaxID=1690608 RepID=A0AAV9PJA1_9PEZI|nr:hypothetical protein LTR77_003907 [Saxophila tyrrhenica]